MWLWWNWLIIRVDSGAANHPWGWQKPQTSIMIWRSSFCWPLSVLLGIDTCMYFPRHCYTCSSLSSHAQLDSGCVYACSCAGMCILCVSLKFEGKSMVVVALRQYCQLMNCEDSAMQWSPRSIIFASCRSTSHVSLFLVNLALVLQLRH